MPVGTTGSPQGLKTPGPHHFAQRPVEGITYDHGSPLPLRTFRAISSPQHPATPRRPSTLGRMGSDNLSPVDIQPNTHSTFRGEFMRLLVLTSLLAVASMACAGNPALVEVGQDGVTIRYSWMTFPVSLEHVTLRGYENIPTPTPDPAATEQPTATPFPTIPAPTPAQPTLTPTPTPVPSPTPTTMEDLAIAWFTALGYNYEYDIAELEDAGVVNAAATYLQDVGRAVAKFEAAGFSDYGEAHCKVMHSDQWPQGWAMTLPEEHRPLVLSDLELAEARYRLAELEKITPPPELQAMHESDLTGLRAMVSEKNTWWRLSDEAERDFWNTHGPDLGDTRFGPCGWPGVPERMER